MKDYTFHSPSVKSFHMFIKYCVFIINIINNIQVKSTLQNGHKQSHRHKKTATKPFAAVFIFNYINFIELIEVILVKFS